MYITSTHSLSDIILVNFNLKNVPQISQNNILNGLHLNYFRACRELRRTKTPD